MTFQNSFVKKDKNPFKKKKRKKNRNSKNSTFKMLLEQDLSLACSRSVVEHGSFCSSGSVGSEKGRVRLGPGFGVLSHVGEGEGNMPMWSETKWWCCVSSRWSCGQVSEEN